MKNDAQNHRFILGIAGKPASGKSEVLDVLAGNGWQTIDADKVVHDLYREGEPGQRKIVDFFGEKFLDKNGDVDRRKLRKIVFSDPNKLKILNKLIRPLVHSVLLEKIQSFWRSGHGKVAIEAIYFDIDVFGDVLNKVLCVDRSDGDIRNVLQERGLSEDQIDVVLGAYVEPFKKDVVIKNNSSLKELEKKVIMAANQFLNF